MVDSTEFLHRTYWRIANAIASWTLTIDGIVLLVALGTWFLTINVFAGIIAGIAFSSAIGCFFTLWLLARNLPLWQATAPFALSIIVCEILVAIWLPELRLPVIPFLAVIILLAGLYGNRRYTIGATVLCILVIFGIIGLLPTSEQSSIPQPLLTFLQATSLAALIMAIWAFLDRIFSAQIQAVQLADQRAAEAEAERQATEMARRELEQRATEQQQLLDLVATLELPVLTVDDRVLLVPLVGNLDSRRANALRQRILEITAERRATTVILDVAGITMIDTAVAKALVDTVTALRLLGAQAIISGIRPTVAQTLVHLNADLGEVAIAPNPEAALAIARRETKVMHSQQRTA
ncbi:MAG: STAS domain-containing protein [Chloroflexus sp.]